MSNLYAELLKASFESLKSASDPGQRASGGSAIELVATSNPVLDKVVPAAAEVSRTLTDAGYRVNDNISGNNKEDSDGKHDDSKVSLEAQYHDPDNHDKLNGPGAVQGEQNMIVNGVFIPDIMAQAEEPVVSIMTPNDVVNPRATILYVIDDDQHHSTQDYLSMEGYKVASTPEQLLALLKR